MIRKITYTVFIISFTIQLSQAQQSPVLGHYMENKILLNPAVAGVNGNSSICLHSRQQWMGYDKSPSTFFFSGETRFLKKRFRIRNGLFIKSAKSSRLKSKVGLGGYIFNDRFGLISKSGFNLSYAYHMFLGETQLSLGLGAYMFQFKVNTEDMIISNSIDPLISDIQDVMYIPDFIFGIHLQSRSFYTGLSAQNLMESQLKISDKPSDYTELRLYRFMIGKMFFVSDKLDIEPSLFFKTTEQFNYLSDITLRFLYNELLWLGTAYRTNGDLSFYAGVSVFFKQYDNMLDIGYAFDYPASPLRKNFGSHELLLKYTIGTTERRYRWRDRY